MSVGDEENEAEESETESTLEPSEDAESEFQPFDEVFGDFTPSAIRKNIAADGLPTQVDEGMNSTIPPFNPKTLVCMGDFSSFVIRDDFGEILFSTTEARRTVDGVWIHTITAEDLKTSEVQDALEDRVLEVGHLIEVRPLRPPCAHYVRQLGDMDLNPEHRTMNRLCAARRTTEGTFMSVRDFGLYACDMREPGDPQTTKLLDDFDKNKIVEGAKRVHHSIFDDKEA